MPDRSGSVRRRMAKLRAQIPEASKGKASAALELLLALAQLGVGAETGIGIGVALVQKMRARRWPSSALAIADLDGRVYTMTEAQW